MLQIKWIKSKKIIYKEKLSSSVPADLSQSLNPNPIRRSGRLWFITILSWENKCCNLIFLLPFTFWFSMSIIMFIPINNTFKFVFNTLWICYKNKMVCFGSLFFTFWATQAQTSLSPFEAQETRIRTGLIGSSRDFSFDVIMFIGRGFHICSLYKYQGKL